MRKLAITITGLVSLIGIIILIITTFNILTQLINLGQIADPDSLEINIQIILPTIFVCYLFYNLWKKPEFYERYKLTTNLTIGGIILTIIIGILFFIYLIISKADLMGLLVLIAILILGAIISFILGIIGFILDKIKLKKQLQNVS